MLLITIVKDAANPIAVTQFDLRLVLFKDRSNRIVCFKKSKNFWL